MPDKKRHQWQSQLGKDTGDFNIPGLSEISERIQYKKLQQIPAHSGYSYRIVSGLISAFSVNKGDKNSFVVYGPGEFFAMEWLVGKLTVSTFFEVLEDCVLERYPDEKFKKLLTTNAEATFMVLCRLVRQSMVYKARLDNLEYQYASQRLAYRILLLGRRFGVKREDGVLLPQLSNHRMARTVNLTRESVNRELAKFVKLGLIRLEDNHILIANEQGLRAQIVSTPQDLYLDNF
ncbi:MAG TPA: Crp/Fnr family transcriptional regulator [Candidatus Saccharimonadales bacterium]|nr:Crp/Fnr family transcriptional regulator [Candidatus Saccharimonadales bacterium]